MSVHVSVPTPTDTPVLVNEATLGIAASGASIINLRGSADASVPPNLRKAYYISEGKNFRIFVLNEGTQAFRDPNTGILVVRPSAFLYVTQAAKYSFKEKGLYLGLHKGETRKHIPLWPASALKAEVGGDHFRTVLPDETEYFSNFENPISPTGLEFGFETRRPMGASQRMDSRWLHQIIDIALPLADDARVHDFQDAQRRRAAVAWARQFHVLHKMVPPLPPRSAGPLTWDAIFAMAELPYLVGGHGRLAEASQETADSQG